MADICKTERLLIKEMMKISDEAASLLGGLMDKKQAEGILAVWKEGSCGKRPLFRLCVFEDGDYPVTINGIRVLIPEDLQEPLADSTLVVIRNRLILKNEKLDCHGNCARCHHNSQ